MGIDKNKLSEIIDNVEKRKNDEILIRIILLLNNLEQFLFVKKQCYL